MRILISIAILNAALFSVFPALADEPSIENVITGSNECEECALDVNRIVLVITD